MYASLSFGVNAVIMFAGYTFILRPRWGRAAAILVPAALIFVVALLMQNGVHVPQIRGPILLPVVIGCVFLLFRDRWAVKIAAILLMESIEVFADMATWPLTALIIQANGRAHLRALALSPDSLYMRVVYWCIMAALITVLVFLWNRYVRSRHLEHAQALLLSASVLLVTQIIFMEQVFEAVSTENVNQPVTWMLVAIDCIGFAMLCTAFGLLRDNASAAARAAALSGRKTAQDKYVTDLRAYAESIVQSEKQLYESIDQLAMLLEYGTDSDVQRRLDSMLNTPAALESGIYAKNSLAVNSLIAQKVTEAQAAGVELEFRTAMDLAPPLSEFDACTILSNVLDNAIAAAGKVRGKRWVRLQILRRAGLLIFECANPYVRGRFASARGREHGFGQSIIRDVTERNGGSILTQKDGVFRLVISLPLSGL